MNPSILVTPNSEKAGKLSSIIPTDGSGDLDVVRATTATYVDADGVIQTALANEVRFDYTNGSCPSILVEPQRTNLLTYSEDFSNASWTKLNTTINSNTIVAPDGNLSADGIYPNNGVDFYILFSGIYGAGSSAFFTKSAGALSVGTYTFSFFIKKNNLRYIQPRVSTASTLITSPVTSNILDLQNKTIFFNDGVSTVKIKDYSNNFVRYEITFNISTSATYYFGFWYWKETSGVTDGTLGYNLCGAQLEQGSNATSYIPTVASTVTRNADVISKTGISDLIGQTEGTVFFDLKEINNKNDFNSIMFSNGTDSFRFGITTDIAFSQLQCLYVSTQTFTSNVLTIPIATKIKIAIKYSIGELKFFANGSLISTFSPLNDFSVNNLSQFRTGRPAGGRDFFGKIDNILLWKTKLTDQECIDLTTL